ncbi:ABC transporter ATP-binding protein [Anaerobium acetethylicum]|uniref:Branched-chain amino acid transport system ATP-binding protein n=1 Tax=Anaerobium acetethylicum TaxID=1619234 RepID=A0A1D3TV50_9FIRM|nr:ABC transporter ATP-binding protein [Anaerobium acetethylicum]SCP97983.1 branched-chain amino acid transport system ATP-binding protein [Anaerobium acetethylicum]
MFLKVENATTRFGGLVANDNVNIEVSKGEIVGLIGPNGAGKSTMFKSINGFNRLSSGEIYFKNKRITKMETYKICKMGITCTFQHAQLFQGITLEESVLLGAYNRRKTKKEALKFAHQMIDFVGLSDKKDYRVSKLNMFERKKAELAAAMATEPELLLLDELFAGLVPTEVDSFVELVRKVNKQLGISILIVEHVLKAIMSLSNKVYVLEYGKIIAHGSPAEVTTNPTVIKAYLGGDYDADVS